MQGIRVKNSEGTVNARVAELNAMLASIEVSEKPTCLDGLAFAFRTAAKAAYGKAINSFMEDAASVADDLFFDELDELEKVTNGRSEHTH
jgi:hypothetical protein